MQSEPPPAQTGCAGRVEQLPDRGGNHVPSGPIEYADSPPASGSHRPIWAAWGEFGTLGPEYWVHNLEHGGAALLYARSSTAADGLRAYARGAPNRPDEARQNRSTGRPRAATRLRAAQGAPWRGRGRAGFPL